MVPPQNIANRTDSLNWPALQPVDAVRVVAGSPETSAIALHDLPHCRFGLWRATEGAFSTDHAGYTEFIHIVGGRGRLVGDDTVVTELVPGASVVIPSGWTGRWEIDQTLVKTYAVIPDAP